MHALTLFLILCRLLAQKALKRRTRGLKSHNSLQDIGEEERSGIELVVHRCWAILVR
jgi:hypothetical protein